MTTITAKEGITGAILVVITIISVLGVQQLSKEQIDLLWVCPVEIGNDNNGIRQCESFSKYGGIDSICNYFNVELNKTAKDRCTKNRINYEWESSNNYINILTEELKEKKVVIEAMSECETKKINISERIKTTCSAIRNNYSDCLEYSKPAPNGTIYCLKYKTFIAKWPCSKLFTKQINITDCINLGYNVTIPGQKSKYITPEKGSCCGLFNESIYLYTVECKQLFNGDCNKKCLQKSIDPDVYDQYCMIYYISEKGIVPKMVGQYPYVLDNQIIVSEKRDYYKK